MILQIYSRQLLQIRHYVMWPTNCCTTTFSLFISVEAERPRMTIIQRMSEMLTRWLEDTAHARRPTPPSRAAESQASASTSADGPSTSEERETFPAGAEEAARAMILDEASSRAEARNREAAKATVESEDSSGEKYVSATSEVEPEETGSDSGARPKGSVKSKKIVKRVPIRKVSSSSSGTESEGQDLKEGAGVDKKPKSSATEGIMSGAGTSGVQAGSDNVQYDEKTKCVDSTSSNSDGADLDKKLTSSVEEEEEANEESSGERKKRKRSVNSSPSGSLTDDTAGKEASSCQETGEGKTDKHVVKSLRVKEGGKDPNDPDSSNSDSEDKDTGVHDSSKPKLDNESKETKSSTKADFTNVQSDEQKQEAGEMEVSFKKPTEPAGSRESSANPRMDRDSDDQGASGEDDSPVFALSQRAEDTNPQV